MLAFVNALSNLGPIWTKLLFMMSDSFGQNLELDFFACQKRANFSADDKGVNIFPYLFVNNLGILFAKSMRKYGFK